MLVDQSTKDRFNQYQTINSCAVRYHGGKYRLAPHIVSYFPTHNTYVEPYGGAASVLLYKQPSYAEVYNDLDDEIVNFFRVLQDEQLLHSLIRKITVTPTARKEFELAWQATDDPVERARRTIIRAQFGFGSAGATHGHTGFKVDTKREYSLSFHLWRDYPENLVAIRNRFMGILIENKPALEVIKNHDRKDTLFYIDPPYPKSTRFREKRNAYRYEMTDSEHQQLLEFLNEIQGMAIISSYPNKLYKKHLKHWHYVEKSAAISGNKGTATRTESLWLNPACYNSLNQLALPLRMVL